MTSTFNEPNGQDEFYYNERTGEVERGKVSPAPERIGPFATAEEAARAKDKLADNAREWAEEEAREEAEDEAGYHS